MSSAKLFGCSINVEAEEEGGVGGSSIAVEVSRSGIQPGCEAMSLSNQRIIRDCNTYFNFLDSNSDSESASMDAEPEFIDFFDRESYDVDTVGEFCLSSNQRACTSGFFNIWEEEVELGLGIGLASGSGSGSGQLRDDSGRVWVPREIDSGRVESGTDVTPVEYNLFGEEAMVVDEELEWENSHNAINWVQEPVQVSLEEEEEEEVMEFFLASSIDDAFHLSWDNITEPATMDLDIEYWLNSINVHHVDYNAIIGQMFDNEAETMGSPPASKSVVNDLPDADFTIEELSNGNIVCAICKDEVVVKEKVKRLPCKHYFHGECIIPWLGIRNTCPVCRYELPTDDLEYERHRRA
ncbi:Zinc finger RING-type [Arabidopsis suecica]|uniref:RING-type E3 ubiquitin transferase n=1 Tax=Arabidopsis suecica TaxID=45249 RepID=A0A8T1Z905_ARASU|nr:Zinc finger RING-type [Arabidopsis suecica]